MAMLMPLEGGAGVAAAAWSTGSCWCQTLVSMREPPGPNCAAGGNQVLSGLDSNHNGVLDPSEVTSRIYVCNSGW
jgi:hypothetical protein